MYIIGGESYNRAAMIYVYDFNGMYEFCTRRFV